MKARWTAIAAKVDAMSPRERVFLFLSIFVVCLGLVDTVWLTPAQTAHRQLTQRFTAQSDELQRLRAELQGLALGSDPARNLRERQDTLDARLAEAEQQLRALAPASAGGPPLEKVLLQFLRKQDGLTLIATGTLDADAPVTAKDPGKDKTEAQALPQGVVRRGLELRVAGSYAALQQYVKTLEAALPQLRWGALQVSNGTGATEMRLQVYVMGVQP